MEQIKILFIASDQKIVDIVYRLINSNICWNGFATTDLDEAKNILIKEGIMLVLVGAGLEPKAEAEFKKYCNGFKQGIILVDHYGGGSGLLSNEILHALEKNATK